MSVSTVHVFAEKATKVRARRRPSDVSGEPVVYLSVTEGELDVCFSGSPDQLRDLVARLVAAAAGVTDVGEFVT